MLGAWLDRFLRVQQSNSVQLTHNVIWRFVGKAPDAHAGSPASRSLDHHTHAHTRTQSLDDCPNWANDKSNHHSATLATCGTVYHCSTHDQS
jgi:hypothetical protein